MPDVQFQKMVITNFGSFQKTTVFQLDRGPGVYYVRGINKLEPDLGANGAGKTTLMNAFYWCCTGRTLRDNRPGDTTTNRRIKDTSSIELTFNTQARGQEILFRSRRPNMLTLNGAEIDDAELASIFGVPPEVMPYTFVFGQTNTMFLDLRPEPQSAMFNELLGAQQYIDSAETCRTIASSLDVKIAAADKQADLIKHRIDDCRVTSAGLQLQAHEFEKKYNARREELKQAVSALEQSLVKQRKRLKTLPELDEPPALKKLTDKSAEAAKARDGWRRRGAVASDNVARLERDINALERSGDKARGGKCPTCGQSLTKEHQKDFDAKLKASITRQKQELVDQQAKMQEADVEGAEWEFVRAEVENAIGEYRKKWASDNGERISLGVLITADEQRLSDVHKSVDVLLNSSNPFISQLKTASTQREELEGQYEAALAELHRAEKQQNLAKMWATGFKEMRLQLIDECLEEIGITSDKHADRLGLHDWSITFSTERENKAGNVSLGFNAMIHTPFDDKPIKWTTYSGGESTRWQLSVAFALGEVLLARAGSVFNIEWLDEPTKGLSDEGVDDLLECLRVRAEETGKTIYLIEQHRLDRAAFNGVITIMKDKQGSHVIEN